MKLIITSQNHLHFKSDFRSVYLKFNIKVTLIFTNSFSNWIRNILFQLTALGPLLYMLCLISKWSFSKRAAVFVRQYRINDDSPNNNKSLSSHLMKHLDVQLYRTEIGICNLDNNSITDFDFQSRFRFKNKMKSKNEFPPVFQYIHQNDSICFT